MKHPYPCQYTDDWGDPATDFCTCPPRREVPHIRKAFINNPPWSPMEIYILQNGFKYAESIETIQRKMPERTTSAIKEKAKQLKLTVSKANMTSTQTIEKLEAELAVKKAEAALTQAKANYDSFMASARMTFANQLKNSPSVTMTDLFKQNSKALSKLGGAVTNAQRKLLEKQIELDIL